MTRSREEAENAGLRVAGVQLDLDCPTSRLPKYADLLHRLRLALPPSSTALSITALPTWYHGTGLDAILHEIDFAAPPYYEANVGRTREDYATVSQPAKTESGLAAAGWRGEPFFAGIPAYGHALVYNSAGRLVGTYHDMGVCLAVRHPAFRLERAFGADGHGREATPATYIGEDVYDLRALVDASDGDGKGFHVINDVPTPASVALHLALLRSKRPPNCRGMILFRYPESGEAETLPLRTVAALLRGESRRPELRVQFRYKAAPWEMMESGTSTD